MSTRARGVLPACQSWPFSAGRRSSIHPSLYLSRSQLRLCLRKSHRGRLSCYVGVMANEVQYELCCSAGLILMAAICPIYFYRQSLSAIEIQNYMGHFTVHYEGRLTLTYSQHFIKLKSCIKKWLHCSLGKINPETKRCSNPRLYSIFTASHLRLISIVPEDGEGGGVKDLGRFDHVVLRACM